VLRPAAFCGVVGFKPSYGRVSTEGMVPYSPSVDTVGWFTQDVSGASLAASVILDTWSDLPASTRPLVVGVPEGPYLDQLPAATRAAFNAMIARLVSHDVKVKSVFLFNDIKAVNLNHHYIGTAEFGDVRAGQFARYGGLFRAGSAALFDKAQLVTPEERAAGLASCKALRENLHAAMDAEGVDVWASTAALGPAPLGLGATGDPIMNLPWTHAGVPAITIPAGTLEGMPIGLQLAGRFGADEQLLAAAALFEPMVR
jgi:Asp-tRNA(Asn)/Glu-tRNA(Gln) amidotransferase A subunit family amidase